MSSPSDQAEWLKQEGNELFKKEDYKGALSKYDEASKLCPDVAVFWSNAAACYNKLEDYKGMKKAATRATEADEGFVKGHYRLAVAQLRLEEFADARVTIERGLALSQQGNTEDFDLLQLQLNDLVALVACANCGKAAASSVCSRCHYTSYCSRECQAAHWNEHKTSCKALASPDTSICNKCGKNLKSLRLCSKCKIAQYCSRTCQLQHWKTHKPVCNQNARANEMFASVGQSSHIELIQAWKSKATRYLGMLGTLCMTKKQFLEQPSSFVVTIQVKFNFNSMTYLPFKDPGTIPIADLTVHRRQCAEAARAQCMAMSAEPMEGRTLLTHIFLIHAISCCNNSSISYQPLRLPAGAFHEHHSREDIEKLIRSECNLNPTLQDSWSPLFSQNFQSQVHSFIEAAGSSWLSFVLYNLRVYSTRPRYKTHAVVIDFEFGFGLGQIGKILGYNVIKLQDARDLYRQATLGPAELDYALPDLLDVENSPRLLKYRVSHPRGVMLPVIFRVLNMLPSITVPVDYELEDGMTLLPPKQCDEKANECFRRLQTVSLPDVSSPDLANVKPAIR